MEFSREDKQAFQQIKKVILSLGLLKASAGLALLFSGTAVGPFWALVLLLLAVGDKSLALKLGKEPSVSPKTIAELSRHLAQLDCSQKAILDDLFIRVFDTERDQTRVVALLRKFHERWLELDRNFETLFVEVQAQQEALEELAEFAQDHEMKITELFKRLSQTEARQDVLEASFEWFQDQTLTQLKTIRKEALEFYEAEEERHSPLLILDKREANNQAGLLNYQNQWISTIGREEEKQQLRRFLYSPRLLNWWLVLGPGGIGKSRLALDLCREAEQNGWHAGFLNSSQDFSEWLHWEPKCPTLIVVDYAAKRADSIWARMGVFCQKDSFEFPVRFLLIERNTSTSWLNEAGRFCDISDLKDILFKNKPNDNLAPQRPEEKISAGKLFNDQDFLILPPLSTQNLREILLNFFENDGETKNVDIDRALIQLKEIDPQARPLFAYFAGQALRDGKNVGVWDRQELMNYILGHWQKIADSSGADKEHCFLLASASITGGLPISSAIQQKIREQDAKYLSIPELQEISPTIWETEYLCQYIPDKENYNHAIYLALLDDEWSQASQDVLPGLGPDLLGEYFVLSQLKKIKDERGALFDIKTFRDICWEKNPSGTGAFLTKLCQDFPEEICSEFFSSLLAPPEAKPNLALLWGILIFELVLAWGQSGELPKAKILHESLAKFYSSNSDNIALRLEFARTTAALAFCLFRNDLPKEIQQAYSNLKKMAQDNPSEPLLRVEQARALHSLIASWGKTGFPQKAEEVSKEFEVLLKEYPEEEPLWEKYAEAVPDLIKAWRDGKNPRLAQKAYNLLLDITQNHLDESEKIRFQAEAAYQLIFAYGEVSLLNEAFSIYKTLEELAKKENTNSYLFLLQAKGAYNLFTYGVMKTKKTPEKQKLLLFGDIENLAKSHSGEIEFQIEYAKAIVNLINIITAQESNKYVKELAELCGKYPSEQILFELYILGKLNLVSSLTEEDGIHEIALVLEELKTAILNNPQTPKFLMVVQKLAGFVDFALQKGEVDIAKRFCVDLKEIHNKYNQEPNIREAWVSAQSLLMNFLQNKYKREN